MITVHVQEVEAAVLEGAARAVLVEGKKVIQEAEKKVPRVLVIKINPVLEIKKVAAIKKEEDEKTISFNFFMYFVFWIFSKHKYRSAL
jgi:microcompartment protein CcmL/EutN